MLSEPKRFFLPANGKWWELADGGDGPSGPGWVAVDEEDYNLALARIKELEGEVASLAAFDWGSSVVIASHVRRLESRVRWQRVEIGRLHTLIREIARTDSFHTARVALASYERKTTPAMLLYRRFCARIVNSRLLESFVNLTMQVRKEVD